MKNQRVESNRLIGNFIDLHLCEFALIMFDICEIFSISLLLLPHQIRIVFFSAGFIADADYDLK